MKENLISGLYKKIKQQKLKQNSNSKLENEFNLIVAGLVEFVLNNPDLTNDDVKLLASTDNKKYVYFDVIFNSFPDLVTEIRKNGDKNILKKFNDKNNQNKIYGDLAYNLNKTIEEIYSKNKNHLKLEFTNKHLYNYFLLELKNLGKGKTRYINSYRSKNSSGVVEYRTDITIKEVCQIVGLVKFFKNTHLSEETIREIVENNYIYDFSVINKIFKNRQSIAEELNNDIYGVFELYNIYEFAIYNEKEKTV